MPRIRRTEITVETDEVMIIRIAEGAGLTLCPTCARALLRITQEEAAVVARMNTQDMYPAFEEPDPRLRDV